MSDDAHLRLLLRQLYESAEAGVKPPGAEAAGRTLRRRVRRKRALALAAAAVLLVGGAVALTNRNLPAPNPPVEVPTTGPSETVSASASPTPSPSVQATVGAPTNCPLPGETHFAESGQLDVFWDPQLDTQPAACQNRPTHILVAHYAIAADRSGVLDSNTRYVLDTHKPKITITVGPPTCEAGALYVANGDITPVQRIANVDQDRPFDRRGVSYSLWNLVTPACSPPTASPTPTPTPSPSP